jgi:hypothetical protein
MARRQRTTVRISLQRFQDVPALLPCRELACVPRIEVMLLREETTMRWKISHHGHDPRQTDLLALAVLIVVIIAAWGYFADRSERPSTATFVVPSQTVRW